MSSSKRGSRWPLANRLARLLHSWWRYDRIRAAPGEGRLLRLEPPCYLLIDEQPVSVEERSVQETAEGTVVIYGCRLVTQPSRLIVKSWDQAAVEWQGPHGVHDMAAAAVEVFSAE